MLNNVQRYIRDIVVIINEKRISVGLSEIAQGTRELLKIASLAISIGVQLLATVEQTGRLKHIRNTQLQFEAGHDDRMGKQLGKSD